VKTDTDRTDAFRLFTKILLSFEHKHPSQARERRSRNNIKPRAQSFELDALLKDSIKPRVQGPLGELGGTIRERYKPPERDTAHEGYKLD
jgi:hypothetical protein